MTNGKPPRRSIFSGVLLILLGALFLWHNLRGGSELWYLFERWWPTLLILWGVVKLYEHMAARRTGETPPRTITGGEVLLVLLLLSLAGTAGMKDWHMKHPEAGFRWPPWARPYSFNEEVSAASVPPNAHISVRTDHGDITIHPEDAAEIRVQAKKVVAATEEAEARSRAQQASVLVTQAADSYEVSTKNQGGEVELNLEVHVPGQATVTARSARGGVQVDGLSGSVMAAANHGDVDIRDAGRDVSVELDRGDAHIVGVRGNVKLSGRGGQVEVSDVKGEAVVQGEYYGPIRIEKVAKGARFVSRRTDLTVSQLAGRIDTGSGRLEISDAPGSLSLVTHKYDLAIDNIGGRIHIENYQGNVELRFAQPPREDVEVSTESGNIELVLPPKSSFEVHAESRKGEIDSDFRDPEFKETKQREGARLEGKIGAKGPQIRLRTTYGTIHLRKGE
jgi:DUF4097 and DUF4098 domain-containing protein YvlB